MAPSEHDPDRSTRPIESSIRTDLRGAMSYGAYLELDRLLSAQHPRSTPEHHDELLFIVSTRRASCGCGSSCTSCAAPAST